MAWRGVKIFTEIDGKEQWSAYCFIKNVYDLWMLGHLEKIRSAFRKSSSVTVRCRPCFPPSRRKTSGLLVPTTLLSPRVCLRGLWLRSIKTGDKVLVL